MTPALLACIVGTASAQTPRPAPAPAATAPGDWPLPGRDPQGTRMSPLAALTPANVARLHPLWTFGTGNLRGHEAAPLVVGGRLYLVTPYPTAVYAFDTDRPGDPPLWRYAPAPGRDPVLTFCCDAVTRGLGWHPSGKLFVTLYPGDLVALDAESGKELWRVRNGDPLTGATMPGAPVVIGNLVVVGIGGGEFGVRGHLTAYEVETGRMAWRAWSTGSDAEVLLTGPANVNYPSHQGRDLGLTTWTADSWRRGGGATWGWLTYDPETDLLFHGTGAPVPPSAGQRIGDNKWTSSLIARDPKTGQARWALQLTPADRWGYDATGESIVTELRLGERTVRAIVHFDANGFAYTIDRATGRILIAEPFGPANWATRINTGTGLPAVEPRYSPAVGAGVSGVCPSLLGMRGFGPAAHDTASKLFFVPASNQCMDFEPVAVPFEAGRPFFGASVRVTPGPGGNLGRFIAWDARTGSIAWEVREPYPVLGGALVTAGGLVFYGTLDGWLKALDAATGRELWRFRTPSGIVSSPITFSAPDGRQYLAVVSGVGGRAVLALGGTGTTSPVSRLGARDAFGDLAQRTNPGGVLLVFGL